MDSILWYTFSIIVQCTIFRLALLETVVFTPALLGKGLHSTWTALPGGRFLGCVTKKYAFCFYQHLQLEAAGGCFVSVF